MKCNNKTMDFGLEDIDQINNLIKETCIKAGLPSSFNRISWEFSNRLSTSLGMAYFNTCSIKFCRRLWIRASAEDRRNVIIHEVVHILAYNIFRDDGHGKHWKALMIKCGGKPVACHGVDVQGIRRPQRRVQVTCGCRTHTVSANKAGRIRNGHPYKCGKCYEPLFENNIV